MTVQRLDALRTYMREHRIDAFLITQPENRRYISGFTGSAGLVLITEHCARLITDFRYFEQVKQESPNFELVEQHGKLEEVLAEQTRELGLHHIGFEGESVTFNAYHALRNALPAEIELVPTTDVLRWQRATKEPEEIRLIRAAVALADQAMETVRSILRPGMSEREVAWKLEETMRLAGAEKLAFDVICAAGPVGAMAHARPSDRPIQAGEPIVIDIGCMVNGYCSDLTRTLILGEPDPTFSNIYDTVLRAQRSAEDGIRPGISGREAHQLAADVIAQAGYADRFGHGLGHGVGLAIHELPALSAASEHILRSGHVFSVEPGIYIPGWGGVRIEDLALLTDQGVEILTRSSKDPIVPAR